MSARFDIELVADARPETGMGHASRCLSLGERLRELGASVSLRVNGSLGAGLSGVGEIPTREYPSAATLGEALLLDWENKRPHLLITDSYQQGADYYRGLRMLYPSVPHLGFDDAGEKAGLALTACIQPHPTEGPQPTEAGRPYPDFAGAHYVLICSDFATAAPKKAPASKPSLLVAFGGSDPQGQTLRLVRLLRGSDLPFGEIRLLLGPAFQGPEAVRETVAGDARFRIHHNPTDLRNVMQTDLAICAGGSTCYELCFLGVPVLVLALAPNQRTAAQAVAAQGCGVFLGDFREAGDAGIVAALKQAASDTAWLRATSARGRNLIDGRGAERLATDLLRFLKSYHGDRFPLEAVLKEYEQSAQETAEYKKLKWGSQEGMVNRFRMARSVIPWNGVSRWLDIGSGTGGFLLEVEQERQVPEFLGLDLSPSLTAFSTSRGYRGRSVRFRTADFLEPFGEGGFDLVTLLGVLQKCGASLYKALGRAAECLGPGGRLFFTTKNLDWKRFREPGFLPEPDHHWFHPADVASALRHAGLEIERMQAFEPRNGEVFPNLEDSHSIFALARKPVTP